MKKQSKEFFYTLLLVIFFIIIIGVSFIFVFNKKNIASSSKSKQIGLNVGNIAPNFLIRTIDGKTISLDDFKNKKAIVVTTTASWCPTCILEAKQLSFVYPLFKDKVEFLSVSIDPTDNASKLEKFRSYNNTPWFYTFPGLTGVRQMILDYGFDRFEITYVIDKNGIIRFKDKSITSADVLKNELSKL